MRRTDEALETLRDDGVILGCFFFLGHRDDGDYLICIMAANDGMGPSRGTEMMLRIPSSQRARWPPTTAWAPHAAPG